MGGVGSLDKRIVMLRPGLSALYFGSGLVLLDTNTGRVFAYNESAAIIWRVLENGGTRDEASAAISRFYSIPPARCLRDVHEIIDDWKARNFFLDPHPCAVPAALTPESQPPFGHAREKRATYNIAGHRFEFSSTDDRSFEHVNAIFQPFQIDAVYADTVLALRGKNPGTLVLHMNGAEHVRTDQLEEMIGAIFQLMLERLHGRSDWLAIVHGAAVLHGNCALVLAGRSGSGKSTLAAFLAASGFGYAADDMAALAAPDGELVPWPVPQSIKKGSWSALRDFIPRLEQMPIARIDKGEVKYLVPPNTVWQQTPRKVRALLFPRYERGFAAELAPLRPLEALQNLLQDRIWLGFPLQLPHVKMFLAWLERIPCYSLRYGDLPEAGGLVRELF